MRKLLIANIEEVLDLKSVNFDLWERKLYYILPCLKSLKII